MAVRHGYGKIAGTDALVFAYDTGDTRNSYRGKPTTNFFPDGHFPTGQNMVSEAGSNATNEIIYLPNNPGNSDYVLKQYSGTQAEYQINLSSALSANTTYVMSGWYGESPDYVGESRMFHARAYSAGGNHNATGNGIGVVLRTVEIGGITWRYCYQTITTPADYSNTFNWYVGYSNTSYTGARYYTNIMMEQGTTPSQYIDGTRSATQGLLDLTGNNTIDLSNVSFDSNAQKTFDGTNDFVDTGYSGGDIATPTLEAVVYRSTSTGRYEAIIQNNVATDDALYVYPAGNLGFWPCAASDLTVPTGQWSHVAVSYDGTNLTYIVNGTVQIVTATCTHITDWDFLRIGAHSTGDGERWIGEIPVVKIYNRALSASELLSNYRHYKNRFNIS